MSCTMIMDTMKCTSDFSFFTFENASQKKLQQGYLASRFILWTHVMQHAKTRLFSLKWDSELLFYLTRGCL